MSEPSDPSKPVPRDLTGQDVGKYRIRKSIGKGAMGQVYRAHDTVLDRDVALKVMASQIADDPELMARFEREAKVVAKLTHPNVVTVFDLGTHTDGSPFIAMELLKGQDLQKTVRKPPPMPLERKVEVIVEVLKGLDHAHKAGIVHRDIKPANIFIQKEDGSVKIMDFGVARLSAHTMTADGNIVGTADYMSPEQVKGEKKVDGRSDLFSVGCLLFELVTGRRPFRADNLMAIFYKITHDSPNFELIPGGAECDALLPILRKALAKNMHERYQTAPEFLVDLREWLRAHATTASSQHVLESLVDLQVPAHAPQPMTEAPGMAATPTGTVDLGGVPGPPGVPRRPGPGPTQISGRTVVDGRAVARPRAAPPPPVARRRARPAPRRSPLPWVALGVVTAAAVGGGAYYSFVLQKPGAAPPVTQAVAPRPTVAPAPTAAATPTPPPVTAAPQPTFAPPEGKAAASVRAANAAFNRGQYDRAVENAQKALREDPSNTTAQQILDKAEKGQQAATRVRAGEAALARGDFAAAEREAEAARALALWDRSVADLRRRIDAARAEARRAAETQAQQQRAAQINDLLNQGATALGAKQYDAALAAYDQVLQIDPGNAAAQTGRTGAISAKSMAEAAAAGGGGAARPAHAFVAGTSVAQASKTDTGNTPPGFDVTPEVEVQRGSQAAALPGRLVIEASPASPKAGDRFSVSAYLANDGAQPIELERMIVSTTIDGGNPRRGPVAPRAATVAPRQRALIFQLRPQLWKQDTTSWEMEIVVFTSKGATYRNTLTWK
jgi:serine/threonine-protein kinase